MDSSLNSSADAGRRRFVKFVIFWHIAFKSTALKSLFVLENQT
jgi:hypothetical protein